METAGLMTGLGPVPMPVLQVHASRFCNLACLHCYSSSGPDTRASLDPARVCQVVTDAAALGYRVLAFSGGEPLAYDGVTEVLRHARSLGLRTSVTTNGTLSTERHLRLMAEMVDVVAVSVDGPPDLHNQIRASQTAFTRTATGLQRIGETGVALGVIHTLTRDSLPHLQWLADFAVASGAKLLQLHPLELFGRGQTTMRTDAAGAEVLALGYVAGFALQRLYAASLAVQVDISHRDHLRAMPGSIYASDLRLTGQQSAADLLGVIVLEQDGTVSPVAYGFGRRFHVCNALRQDLRTAWQSYVETGYLQFRRLCRAAWQALADPETPTLLNWHDLIVARSITAAS